MMYEGGELALFAEARQWKTTLHRLLAPFLGKNVLEVGAGIGATTAHLCGNRQARWICLEPDPRLAAAIDSKIEQAMLPKCCTVIAGTLGDLAATDRYDTVLYIDVLEHIADDAGELAAAAAHLLAGGHLIVVAPAHPILTSPFDREVGHFRRYTAPALRRLSPRDCVAVTLFYADSLGLFLSLANRLLLRRNLPTAGQIQIWDRLVVPLSRLFDRLTGRRLGKTVIAVWRHR